MAYHHNASNTSCFVSLSFAFTESGESNAAGAIVIITEEELNSQYQGYKDRIVFDNSIMSDQVSNPG